MTKQGTKDRDPAVKARAEALFRLGKNRSAEVSPPWMTYYQAKEDAERAKMAKLRALWLAAEAKAADEPNAKRKPGGMRTIK